MLQGGGAGDVTIDTSGAIGDVTIGAITSSGTVDISLKENLKNSTLGAISGKDVKIDASDAVGTLVIGDKAAGANGAATDITVSDSLIYTAGLKGANDVDSGAPLDIDTTADATETTIELNGNIGDDKFDIYGANTGGQTITVKGDLGIGTNAVTVTGNSGADTIDLSGLENGGTVTIDGGTGADTIIGSAGNDTIKVGDADTSIDGGDGDDTLLATVATLDLSSNTTISNIETIDLTGTATGLTVSSAISGVTAVKGDANDVVTFAGGSDADTIDISGITFDTATATINGGAGADTITLGDGADTIKFADTAANNGVDSISSFTAGSTNGDIFDFSAFNAATVDTTADGSAGDSLNVNIANSLDYSSNTVNVIALADIQEVTDDNFGGTASATVIKTAASSKYLCIADKVARF